MEISYIELVIGGGDSFMGLAGGQSYCWVASGVAATVFTCSISQHVKLMWYY